MNHRRSCRRVLYQEEPSVEGTSSPDRINDSRQNGFVFANDRNGFEFANTAFAAISTISSLPGHMMDSDKLAISPQMPSNQVTMSALL